MDLRKPIVLSLAAAFLVLIAGAGQAQGPALSDHPEQRVTLISRQKSNGNIRWHSQLYASIIKAEGTTYLYFEEKGVEPAEDAARSKTWSSYTYSLLEQNQVRPYLIKVEVKDAGGSIMERVEKFYDYKSKIVICNVNGRVQILNLKGETADKQDLAFYLMNYPFDERNELDLLVVDHTPAIFPMTVKYRGKGFLDSGGRSVLCHKLEMLPDIGFLNFLRIFLPKTYLWFEAEPPHYFVRYEGLESGLGTPYVVVEAIRQ